MQLVAPGDVAHLHNNSNSKILIIINSNRETQTQRPFHLESKKHDRNTWPPVASCFFRSLGLGLLDSAHCMTMGNNNNNNNNNNSKILIIIVTIIVVVTVVLIVMVITIIRENMVGVNMVLALYPQSTLYHRNYSPCLHLTISARTMFTPTMCSRRRTLSLGTPQLLSS